MNISKELLEKAETCKTAEELVALAKENGMELSLEEAKSVLEKKEKKELTADEIDAVAGGYKPGEDGENDGKIYSEEGDK